MPTACALAIGNELLNGTIRDLNIYQLSRSLTQLGFDVVQACITPDDPRRIANSLNYLLSHTPDIIVIGGGLGPTDDDMTLSALAAALNVPLVYSQQARDLVERHYDQLIGNGYLHNHGPEHARQKMSHLPEGAIALYNPVGTAPGIKLQVQACTLYVLPGVPRELEAIFTNGIIPDLQAHFKLSAWAQAAILVHCDDEADVVQALHHIAAAYPDVYLKSLAKPFPSASKEGLRVIAATHAQSEAAARLRVEAALQDLRHALEGIGFVIETVTSP